MHGAGVEVDTLCHIPYPGYGPSYRAVHYSQTFTEKPIVGKGSKNSTFSDYRLNIRSVDGPVVEIYMRKLKLHPSIISNFFRYSLIAYLYSRK